MGLNRLQIFKCALTTANLRKAFPGRMGTLCSARNLTRREVRDLAAERAFFCTLPSRRHLVYS